MNVDFNQSLDSRGSGANDPAIGNRKAARQRGSAIVEFALVAPLLTVLALSVMDAGVYVTAFIAVQNAARAGASRNSGGSESASDQSAACRIATDQLRGLPGIASGTCGAAPLVVSSVYCDGPSACGTAAATADGKPAALVTVRYTLPALFHIPLTGPGMIALSSQMRIRNYE